MTAVKQGTYFHLEVDFDGVELDTVDFIEFIFAQVSTSDKLKSAIWKNGENTNLASRVEGTNTIRIGFSDSDTYKFRRNSTFYMDTRIHLKDSIDNPQTNIVELTMNPTLFKTGWVDNG